MHFPKLVVLTQLIALCVATTIIQRPHSPEELRDLLKKEEIIPQILSDFTPSCALSIFYSSGSQQVHYGNRISPSDTKDAPHVYYKCSDPENYQTDSEMGFIIALTDPDAPSRDNPKWSQMCHWLSGVGSSGKYAGCAETKKDLIEYKQPGPPKNKGYHRYIFVLMYGNTTDLEAPSDRERWGFRKNPHHGKGRDTKGVQEWAEREGMKVVGANWFMAKHEKD